MIYVNGDSWSARQLQVDDNQIWPKLIADQLNQTLVNESVGCGSNSRMQDCLETFLIAGNRPNLVIIALSGHSRWHMPAADLGHWLINSSVAINDRTGETDELLRDWNYKKSYNELDSVFRYYKNLWSMHELCKQFNVPCVFFQSWDQHLLQQNITEQIEHHVSKSYDLSDVHAKTYVAGFRFFQQQKKYWNYVDSTSFRQLLTPKELDSTLHPNHRGHEIISIFVHKQLLNYKLLDYTA